MASPMISWPEGKAFAFTIVDDTDHATVERVKPIYDLLAEVGMRTTKTVWVEPTDAGNSYGDAQTLSDPEYAAFINALKRDGFEIALHGVRGCSSTRKQIEAGLQKYKEIIGQDPNIHINHCYNQDNVYWGKQRFTFIRRLLHLYRGRPGDSHGHDRSSEHYWSDLLNERVRYVRGHIFKGINTLACDPYMPAFDPMFPDVRAWFSSSDGHDPETFYALLGNENQALLEEQGGACIVYTHLGLPGFRDESGGVHPRLEQALTGLAQRNGWFVPAEELLGYLAGGAGPSRLTWSNRMRMLLHKWLRY